MARFNEVRRKSGAKLTRRRMEIFRELAQTKADNKSGAKN